MNKSFLLQGSCIISISFQTFVLLPKIGPPEEASKKYEIAQVHSKRPVNKRICSVVTFPIRLLRQVSIDKDAYIHAQHHLQYLQHCNEHIDPDWRLKATRSTNSVVEVHNGMNKVVESNEPLRWVDLVGIVIPAKDEDGDVVVPMQEDQRSLAYNNEVRIRQLG